MFGFKFPWTKRREARKAAAEKREAERKAVWLEHHAQSQKTSAKYADAMVADMLACECGFTKFQPTTGYCESTKCDKCGTVVKQIDLSDNSHSMVFPSHINNRVPQSSLSKTHNNDQDTPFPDADSLVLVIGALVAACDTSSSTNDTEIASDLGIYFDSGFDD